jgi:hypothetical protein
MVDSTDIEQELNDKEYKTPVYIRASVKRYYSKHADVIKLQRDKYRRKKIEEHDEKYYALRKKANTDYNRKKKEKGITPEEKAARAKYMREYRAKKKMEKIELS